jgi:hypothetical protein
MWAVPFDESFDTLLFPKGSVVRRVGPQQYYPYLTTLNGPPHSLGEQNRAIWAHLASKSHCLQGFSVNILINCHLFSGFFTLVIRFDGVKDRVSQS